MLLAQIAIAYRRRMEKRDGASPYGILDMAGNQWEWVSSVYLPHPYRSDDGRESQNPGRVRSPRGGGHDSSEEEIITIQGCRNLSRNPKAGHHNIGLQCAKPHTLLLRQYLPPLTALKLTK